MDYGYFSQDGREFVITRPDTPRPWINYLSNGSYCALISQTAGGYSFVNGSGYDRITRAYPGEMVIRDIPGRYIYIRDDDSGDFWSPTWQPVRKPLDHFECRHTQGITTINSSYSGIHAEIVYFVPLDDNLEIWRVRIENKRAKSARLTVFTYQEWVLGSYGDDLQDRAYFNLFNDVEFQDNYISATKRIWRRPDLVSLAVEEIGPRNVDPKFMPETIQSNHTWGKYAFLSLSVGADAFDCSKEAFLGAYGSIERPEAVVNGSCTNSDAQGKEAVGVLQHSIEIPPGEAYQFDVFLGITFNQLDIGGIVARLSDPQEIDSKLEKVREYWDNYLGKLEVGTQDRWFDLAANIWSKYQCWMMGHWARMASYYGGGSSAIGFRDSCFDLLGILPVNGPLSRAVMYSLLQHQFEDGSCVHYWEPRSNVGTYTGHSDDPLWLVFAITSYLKETGDASFLDERVKYYYGHKGVPVYDHLTAAIDYCLSRLSPRNLLRMGTGDWNDVLDQVGREGIGESVFSTELLGWALQEGIKLADFRGDKKHAAMYRRKYADVKEALNNLCWDGAWYIRAFDDEERAIGSNKEKEGSIYLDVQNWAVISGIAADDKAARSMESVRKHLETPYGPALLLPAYGKPDKNIGTITRFIPGMGANGSVSTLAAAWAVIAECMLGRGDRAYLIYKQTLFTERSQDEESYKAEPYVHADYVCGPASAVAGEGHFTWATGSAPWMWRAALDYILGIRPDYTGLLIDPCIPSSWRQFTVTRPYRNAVYKITVTNPQGVSKGVKSITVDGKQINTDHTLQDFADGRTHIVEVVMGNP